MEMLELNCENAKIYRISKTLKRPFSTSSGTLTHKDIIVIVFENNHRPEFIFELPFSPSMGEMPDSFIENMQNGNSYYFDVARSWYEYFKARQKLPLVSNPIEQCIHTYGIGDIEFSDSGLIRMKGAATNLDELIKLSWRINKEWMVDFNASLDEKQLQTFLQKANLQDCLCIEQPIRKDFDKSLHDFSFKKFRADESMAYFKQIAKIKKLGYTSVVLKPIYYKANDFFALLKDASELGIDTIIGSVSCDNIFMDFCKLLNNSTSIYTQNLDEEESMFADAFKTHAIYSFKNNEIVINEEIFKELQSLSPVLVLDF